MARHVALLRAINVGGHRVTMERLRQIFEAAGLRAVKTFQAAGNVIFEAPETGAELEPRLELQLQRALGYDVATFIRSPAELSEAASWEPFPLDDVGAAHALYVGFARSAPAPAASSALLQCCSETDDLAIRGREVYWLRRVPLDRAPFSGARLERTLGMPVTLRNITTVRTLAVHSGASDAHASRRSARS